MKRLITLTVACSFIAVLGYAADETTVQGKPETYTIVKYFDHGKVMSYKLVSSVEYKALLEEIAGEAKIWEKAMSASEKSWKAEGSTSKKFPRSAISPKKVMTVDTFTDQEKATSRMNNMEQALTEAEKAKQDIIDKREKEMNKMRGNKPRPEDRGTSDREALMESARSLFESKLSELSGGTLGSQAPAAAAPEAKEKEKEKEKDKDKEKDKKAGDKK